MAEQKMDVEKQIILYTNNELMYKKLEEFNNWRQYETSLKNEKNFIKKVSQYGKEELEKFPGLWQAIADLITAYDMTKTNLLNKKLLVDNFLTQSMTQEDVLAIEASPEQLAEQTKKIEELNNVNKQLTIQYNDQLINEKNQLTNQYNNQAQQLIDEKNQLLIEFQTLEEKYDTKQLELDNFIGKLEQGDEEKAGIISAQIENLQKEKATLRQQLKTNSEKLATTKDANNRNEKKVNLLNAKVLELQKTVDNKTLLLTQSTNADNEKDSTISKLKKEKQKLQQEKETLKLNLGVVKVELAESQKREQTASTEANNLITQKEELQNEIELLTNGSASALEDLAKERNGKIADLNQEISQLTENVATLTRERKELADEKNAIQSTLNTLADTLKTSESTATEALTLNVRLQEKVDSNEEILSSNKDTIKSLEGTKAELEEKVRALTVDIELAKNATVLERQRADNSENALTVATEQISTLEEQAEEMKRGIEDKSGHPAQLQKANEEYNRLRVAYNKLERDSNQTEKDLNILVEEKEQLSELLEAAVNNASLSEPIADNSYSERALKNVRLWELRDGEVTDFFEMDEGSFSPDVHKKLLLFNEHEKDIIANALIASRQFKTLPVYDARAKEYTSQLYDIVDDFDDDDGETGVKNYAAILKSDIMDITSTYGKIVDGEAIPTTSKSKKNKPETGVKEYMPFTFGAPVFALNMIDTMNQVVWQSKVNELNEAMPGSFTVQMRFSKGLNPRIGTKEFHFVARNVHLIKDPTGASDDVFYVINLANAASLENMHYIELGSLVMNSIYGLGSLNYRILTSDRDLVKEDLIREYRFPEDEKREYNTKVMLHPKEDVTFYARDTKNNTYHLETILIKA